MMSGGQQHDFHDEIDWGVFKKQQIVPPSLKASADNQNPQNAQADQEDQDPSRMDVPLGQNPNQPPMVDTFLGKMPDPRHSKMFDPNDPAHRKQLDEMINAAAGGPGMKVLGEGIALAKPLIAKGASAVSDYLQPGKAAEAFRSKLGSGTSSENISELSKRAQLAKQSSQQEALIPKNELYAQEGKSNVYNVDKTSLPEGNLDKMSHMIAPGEQFGESEANSLSKAISKYRKSGNIEDFNQTAEDIFNIPELGEKAASKIEDALSLPTKRDSAYFSDSDVTMPYSKKGNLMTQHNEYQTNPTMNNYQDLRSAITTQMRKLKGRAKTDDVAAEKYEQMKANLTNLDSDASNFIQTLPENMQNLDSQFRQKYAQYAQTYTKGDKEMGASLTLRRLAEGRHDLVDDSAITRLFSKPTAADKQAILDMGSGAGRNAIYSALQRVKPGDAEGMANTLLELKRTKGFDKFITPEMETWANNMLNQTRRAGMIKKSIGSVAGMGVGAMAGGPLGAVIGGALPWGKEYGAAWGKILASKFKK
jgi:hypothetical protein